MQRRGYAPTLCADTAQGTNTDSHGTPFKMTPSKRKRRGGGVAARGEVTRRRWLWLFAKLSGTLPPPLPAPETVSCLPPAVSAKATVSGEHTEGRSGRARRSDVVVLVDGDNSGNIFKQVEKFVAAGAQASPRQAPDGKRQAHAFVSRHYDGKCPPSITLHHATTGLPDAADHEITFFAGMSVPQITAPRHFYKIA